VKIDIPSKEEILREQKSKRHHFIGGIIFGLLFFALAGTQIFRYGFDEVNTITWIALAFGVLSFGLLARWFGPEFWSRITGL